MKPRTQMIWSFLSAPMFLFISIQRLATDQMFFGLLWLAVSMGHVALFMIARRKTRGCMQGRCPHKSDCAVHSEPYEPAGPCNCGAAQDTQDAKDAG